MIIFTIKENQYLVGFVGIHKDNYGYKMAQLLEDVTNPVTGVNEFLGKELRRPLQGLITIAGCVNSEDEFAALVQELKRRAEIHGVELFDSDNCVTLVAEKPE